MHLLPLVVIATRDFQRIGLIFVRQSAEKQQWRLPISSRSGIGTRGDLAQGATSLSDVPRRATSLDADSRDRNLLEQMRHRDC